MESKVENLASRRMLSNGVGIPCVGFGTWQTPSGDVARDVVKKALEVGFRHIDTATAYGNEASVGEGIRLSGVKREDVFITTKQWTDIRGCAATIAAAEKAIQTLGVDYLDLFEAMAADFERVNVRTFDFAGYAAPIFNKDVYFKANMDLLDPKISAELFPEGREIKTKAHDNAPAKLELGSHVRNSRISGSCRIYGTVTNSILGRNVLVEPGAVVNNAIVMQSCIVRSGAHIEYAVVDRNNEVPADIEVKGTPEALFIKEKAAE